MTGKPYLTDEFFCPYCENGDGGKKALVQPLPSEFSDSELVRGVVPQAVFRCPDCGANWIEGLVGEVGIRFPDMTGNQYATEVLRIVNDGTIRAGVWSEHDRDALLKAISQNYTNPGDRLELVIDNPATANFRLTQDPTDPHRVRVADYRMSVITRREPGPDIHDVNQKLAAIGRNT